MLILQLVRNTYLRNDLAKNEQHSVHIILRATRIARDFAAWITAAGICFLSWGLFNMIDKGALALNGIRTVQKYATDTHLVTIYTDFQWPHEVYCLTMYKHLRVECLGLWYSREICIHREINASSKVFVNKWT